MFFNPNNSGIRTRSNSQESQESQKSIKQQNANNIYTTPCWGEWYGISGHKSQQWSMLLVWNKILKDKITFNKESILTDKLLKLKPRDIYMACIVAYNEMQAKDLQELLQPTQEFEPLSPAIEPILTEDLQKRLISTLQPEINQQLNKKTTEEEVKLILKGLLKNIISELMAEPQEELGQILEQKLDDMLLEFSDNKKPTLKQKQSILNTLLIKTQDETQRSKIQPPLQEQKLTEILNKLIETQNILKNDNDQIFGDDDSDETMKQYMNIVNNQIFELIQQNHIKKPTLAIEELMVPKEIYVETDWQEQLNEADRCSILIKTEQLIVIFKLLIIILENSQKIEKKYPNATKYQDDINQWIQQINTIISQQIPIQMQSDLTDIDQQNEYYKEAYRNLANDPDYRRIIMQYDIPNMSELAHQNSMLFSAIVMSGALILQAQHWKEFLPKQSQEKSQNYNLIFEKQWQQMIGKYIDSFIDTEIIKLLQNCYLLPVPNYLVSEGIPQDHVNTLQAKLKTKQEELKDDKKQKQLEVEINQAKTEIDQIKIELKQNTFAQKQKLLENLEIKCDAYIKKLNELQRYKNLGVTIRAIKAALICVHQQELELTFKKMELAELHKNYDIELNALQQIENDFGKNSQPAQQQRSLIFCLWQGILMNSPEELTKYFSELLKNQQIPLQLLNQETKRLQILQKKYELPLKAAAIHQQTCLQIKFKEYIEKQSQLQQPQEEESKQ